MFSSSNIERRKAPFVCASSVSIVSILIIIASVLVLAGGFAPYSPSPMTIPNAFAQEEDYDNTTVGATTTMNNDTTTATATTTSSGLELSPQPIWDEEATTTGRTTINQTHSIVSFIGNGTMTVPDTGQTINMTNNGTGLVSPVPGYTDTVSAYGREHVLSEDDGDTSAITFYEIIRYDPETFEGKGLVIAVFDKNATGMLAPFNGMMVVGTHEEDPNTPAAITLWEWETAIPLLPPLPTIGESSPSLMSAQQQGQMLVLLMTQIQQAQKGDNNNSSATTKDISNDTANNTAT